MSAFVVKMLWGLLGPVVLGVVRKYAYSVWEKIPELLKPVASGVVGAVASATAAAIATASTGQPVTVEALGTAAVAGAVGGSLARDARDVFRAQYPESISAGSYKIPGTE